MSNKDIITDSNILLNALIDFPRNYTLKLHKMYKPSPVRPNWQIEEHRVNEDLHLLFVLDGYGNYSLNHVKKNIKKGQLMIVSNDYPHGARSDSKRPLHIFSLRFGVYSNKHDYYIPSFFKTPFALSLTPKDPQMYTLLLDRMYHHYLEQKPESQYAINVLLNQLLLNICEEPKNLDTSSKMKAISDLIIHNHGKNLNVNQLATNVQLSIKQFTRLFTKYNHITPHQFIISTRINYAKHLLEDTNMSISEISNDLGYVDSFCFSKQFKKVVGLSPSNFRSVSINSSFAKDY